METMTFQEMLERPPQPQVIERSAIPPNGRNAQQSPPHEWSLRKLREAASQAREKTSQRLDDIVQMLETLAVYIDMILENMALMRYSVNTRKKVSTILYRLPYFYSANRLLLNCFANWQGTGQSGLDNLNERRDVPNQLKKRLNKSLEKLRAIRSRFEKSWTILQSLTSPSVPASFWPSPSTAN